MLAPLFRALLISALAVTPAAAVIVAGASGGGNTSHNTTSAQFLSEYGFEAPVIDNIIAYSDASAVYLGYNPATADVWVLTARHVTSNASAGATVIIDGLTYQRQADGADGFGLLPGGDLRLVRYRHDDLAVPSLPAVEIATTMPIAGAGLLMAGFGQNRTQNATTGAFTSDASAFTVGTGYNWSGTRLLRWGTNAVESEFLNALESGAAVSGTTGTFSMGSYTTSGFMTDFDQPGIGQWLSANESQGSLGDSGGGAFTYDGSRWYLAGIFSAVVGFQNQPSSTSAFGNLSLLTNVASYSASIDSALGGATLIPEPSSLMMAAATGGACLLRRRRFTNKESNRQDRA
jgi:hypothetical protein